MMNQCEHISGEKLSELLDGMLPEAERLAVEAHLADCADCRRERDALLHVIASLGALPVEHVSDGFRQGVMDRIAAVRAPAAGRIIPLRCYMVRALPIAATLLIAVSIGLSIFGVPWQPGHGDGDLTAASPLDVPEDPLNAPQAPAPKGDGTEGEEGRIVKGHGTESEHDAADGVEAHLKTRAITPEAAVMDKGLAECAQDAFAGVHQTLTMEADDPDALAQRAVAVAAGLGVNATIVPSAKKLKGATDIRVRLTIPRAQYEELLKKLANLTPAEQRQMLENASESNDVLLAEAPTRHGNMRRKATYRDTERVDGMAMAMSDSVKGMRHIRKPGPLAPEGADVAQARRAPHVAEQASVPGVSLAAADDAEGEKETAWITLIIRVVLPQP